MVQSNNNTCSSGGFVVFGSLLKHYLSVLHFVGSSISTLMLKDNVRFLTSQRYELSAAARNVVQSSM